MNLQNVRKIIITSRLGLILVFAVPFFIAMLFTSGAHQPLSLIINAFTGGLFGLLMSSRFRKNNQYFIQNIESNQYSLTKKYNKLFKAGDIPMQKDEQDQYLKHLSGLEKLYDRSKIGEIAGFLFLLTTFVLSVVIDHRLSWLNVTFAGVIILAGYGYVHSRKALTKIARLRAELNQAEGKTA